MKTTLQLGPLVADGRLATVHRASLGGRAVAVKRARADVPGAAAALRREGRVLTAASHPAIVPVLDVLDVLDARNEPALVLGWADGGSLGDLLADGPVTPEDLLHLLRPLAGGLEALHASGVAHLDVNVENVLLAAAGPVLVDPAPPGAGTPGYADPAVAAGAPPSPRSDVFGLAACAHVALTGRLPRTAGGTAVGVALPEAVRAVLAAGLHPDPRRRPASPSCFVDRLAQALGIDPPAEDSAATARIRTRSHGRPVVRAAPAASGPARTWPFDRWHEEAEAAAERRAAVAQTIGPVTRAGRAHRARRILALRTLLAGGAAGVLVGIGSFARAPEGPEPRRLTAPDVPLQPVHRPPTTPGGSP